MCFSEEHHGRKQTERTGVTVMGTVCDGLMQACTHDEVISEEEKLYRCTIQMRKEKNIEDLGKSKLTLDSSNGINMFN